MDFLNRINKAHASGTLSMIGGLPQGATGLAIATLVQNTKSDRGLAYVADDHQEMAAIRESLSFYAPWLEIIEFPGWDCLPYDRVSPSNDVSAQRIHALSALVAEPDGARRLFLTTANAIVQRVVPRGAIRGQAFRIAPGMQLEMDQLVAWLSNNAFERTPTVRDEGEFAVRGGILDFFTPGAREPIRLDFFGDTIETIRSFDPANQRTTSQLKDLTLQPMSEVFLTSEAIKRFRQEYLARFGADTRDDALYEAVSDGRRYAGMEHWLPLFHERLETTFDYLEGWQFANGHLVTEAVAARLDMVRDHHKARSDTFEDKVEGSTPYKPVAVESLYLSESEVTEHFLDRGSTTLSPFEAPQGSGDRTIALSGKTGRSFSPERNSGANVFDAVIAHVQEANADGQTVGIACWSDGSASRMEQVLGEHGLTGIRRVDGFGDIGALKKDQVFLAVLPLEEGFQLPTLTIIAEQDILGDRLVRKRRKKVSNFITEATSLAEGDIVVHVEHGIARFIGLKTIEAAGAPHDCLELHYAGEDKLFLPVENIELLSRYGSSDSEVALDRLGGVAWQTRKAKLKKRILEMAGQLIKVAAERALKKADRIITPDGLYDEFASRFPYEETEDQLNAIEAVMDDLAKGQPMDRLICGDVGFGKTEVALRAAFAVAMAGKQVAVVVPTTLLARQHYKTFSERFKGLPVNVKHASRLVSAGELAETKKGIADGTVDIVVGTHALLGANIEFSRLGLLVIDEEQRFGVKHKERLKELRTDVHVLTLSATPIPRTLQLALTGVRELSLITTAPVDRMAVRTFISPFDKLVVREALLRERYRGGQSFFVCPRVSDLAEQKAFLDEHVPELKVAVAHGQMAPGELDDVMNAFYDQQFDVLLSTTIVESGLDIPTANTLIVHRADMFGLAQLYQLRGRVGRSKTRAYALFTLPARKVLTATAEKRLKVLQSLDSIGAGFELASHDLDIRGSGNLLGEQQSGQIREVGYELYQQMLEEAVAELREGDDYTGEDRWSPQISVGTPVLIPETYVPDLSLRLNLYRRLADISEPEDIDAFSAEMIDRFGPLPLEVDHLMKIVFIKGLCHRANVEKLDAGPKGAVVTFRNDDFANPPKLIQWIAEQGAHAKIRPNQSVFFARDWETADKRLKGSAVILTKLAQMAEEPLSSAA